MLEIAEVEGTSFIDDEVEEGNTYTYYVKATNLLGEGPSSVPADVEVSAESSGTSMVLILAIVIIAIVVVAVAVFFIRRR